jgi:hypothetical protein
MDHLKAYILINGERVTDAPGLWGFSRGYVFDPRIPVPAWPPQGAAFVAAERERDPKGATISSIELALDGALYDLSSQSRLRKAYPHLEPGEMVLYVDARRDDQCRRGALRLRVVGDDGGCYRYTNFSPIQSMEEDNVSRFRRAIWFQREPSE